MMKKTDQFSDYIVYVDESGDHNLTSIDDEYPVFVLAFCVFYKQHYSTTTIPAIEKFKFKHFGHDCTVLHEHEIRKRKNSFSMLNTNERYDLFLNELSQIMADSNFILIACVVDKIQLKQNQNAESNAYHIALEQCLDSLYLFLEEKNQQQLTTHIVFECRGKKEDNELELAFLRYCKGENRKKISMPFKMVFADKKTNAVGLQLADLVARPIGLNHIRPTQNNRAFDILKEKFFCRDGRNTAGNYYDGYGLKVYPNKNIELQKAKNLDECTKVITPTRNAQST